MFTPRVQPDPSWTEDRIKDYKSFSKQFYPIEIKEIAEKKGIKPEDLKPKRYMLVLGHDNDFQIPLLHTLAYLRDCDDWRIRGWDSFRDTEGDYARMSDYLMNVDLEYRKFRLGLLSLRLEHLPREIMETYLARVWSLFACMPDIRDASSTDYTTGEPKPRWQIGEEERYLNYLATKIIFTDDYIGTLLEAEIILSRSDWWCNAEVGLLDLQTGNINTF